MEKECIYSFNKRTFYHRPHYCVKEKCIAWDKSRGRCIFQTIYSFEELVLTAKKWLEITSVKDEERG